MDLPLSALLIGFANVVAVLTIIAIAAYNGAIMTTSGLENSDTIRTLHGAFLLLAVICWSIYVYRSLHNFSRLFHAIGDIASAIIANFVWFVFHRSACHVCDGSTNGRCEDCNVVACPRHLVVENKRTLCNNCAEKKK